MLKKKIVPLLGFPAAIRSFSQLISYPPKQPSFGIAFDIDGVILRGEKPIGGSPGALRRLYDPQSVTLKIPYVFLTNGGGFCESKRALELSKLLGLRISPSQIIQGHTPFKQLVERFKSKLSVAVGKGEPAAVMSEYGFKNVLSIDEYASCFDNIDPLLQYKKWTTGIVANQSENVKSKVFSERVHAVFIVSDSVDWSRDIQVLCDILRSGLPGKESGYQPPLFFANDDLEYQGVFPCERLGMGAFRIALESIFNSVNPKAPLEYTCFGKPNPSVFRNAETVLREMVQQQTTEGLEHNGRSHSFSSLYMIGDNPSVDIRGARQAGQPWFSILTRTGVFKGVGNHSDYPADLVVDTVEDAIEYIFRREGI
ncbi:uncharacterized protein YKR070W [Impatiens glandulifera]|uniref:uncharacterized protein YKR070W n=1 Tax=Impatiens glandulifera TaxID=253017 RepID=UPI001FB0F3D9|nr:uncharacterized protein YKR070W [Impatiens glandulifera]